MLFPLNAFECDRLSTPRRARLTKWWAQWMRGLSTGREAARAWGDLWYASSRR